MKVLQVIPSLATRTGGPAVSVADASQALGDRGLETRILTTDLARPARAQHEGRVSKGGLPLGYENLDVRFYPSRPPRRLALSPALGRALRNTVSEYDVVHIHSLFLYPQYVAYRAASGAEVPYVVSPRGALDPWLRTKGRIRKAVTGALWQQKMLAGASAIHVTSDQEAEFTEDIAVSVSRCVVPNGINWNAYQSLPSPTQFRQDVLDGFDGPLILFHGRLARKKGLDVLIRALALVRAELPGCRLALVGPDDENLSGELVRLAEELHVADDVVFCGMLGGTELLAALSAADVWALSSHTENFAVAAVEALAAGCPSVMSPSVGVAREAERAGAAVVSELEPRAFAKELSRLLRDEVERRELGERARQYARRFDWSEVAPLLEGMYKGACS